MFKSLPRLALVATAVASPVALHAQTNMDPSDGPPAYSVGEFIGIHPGQSAAAGRGPIIDISSARPPADRAYADSYAAPQTDGRSPTAVDYRLARDGFYGSVGYICLGGIAPVAPYEAAVTAGSDGGRLLGASLKYPFR